MAERRRFKRPAALAAALLVLAGMAAAEDVPAPPDFGAWLSELRVDARANGIPAGLLDAAFEGLEPNPRVIELDRRQPEFVQTLAQYFEARVTPERIDRGRTLRARHRALLAELESRFGIDRDVLLAIWGIESSFGRHVGNMSVIRSVATLAWDRRRSTFFRRELLAALEILRQGHASVDGLLGGWAGAMGQPQFMPSTFLAYARDFDGDGRADIWDSEADALASIAAFLRATDWETGLRWGWPVRVPRRLDADAPELARGADATCTAFREHTAALPLEAWRERGLRGRDGIALPGGETRAALIRPGPDSLDARRSWLVSRNFAAVLRYNCANKYALAVGRLADAIARERPGGPGKSEE